MVGSGWMSLFDKENNDIQKCWLELDGVPDLALPHTSCVTLGKLLHLSESPFLVCSLHCGQCYSIPPGG